MQQSKSTGGRVLTSGKALKAEAREAFGAQGFLSPVPSIGRDRAVTLRREIERIELLNGGASAVSVAGCSDSRSLHSRSRGGHHRSRHSVLVLSAIHEESK